MKIGFLINPIAGMGGRVGLKGTDDVLDEAINLGAEPIANDRALGAMFRFIELIKNLDEKERNIISKVEWYTCSGTMGFEVLNEVELEKYCDSEIKVVYKPSSDAETSPHDTKEACMQFATLGVDLVLFCGGDGTARDVFSVIQDKALLLGIPSGVKMHSGVFATHANIAGDILLDFFNGKLDTADGEILDLDEDRYRAGEWNIRLFGIAKTPFEPTYIQQGKHLVESASEDEIKAEIAEYIKEEMMKKYDTLYILGSGSTLMTIAKILGLEGTLLGIDALFHDKLIGNDLNENELLDLLTKYKDVTLILSPIGAQGFILGRGNLQLSPKVIKTIGIDKIDIVSTPAKLKGIEMLRVDTNDHELDLEFVKKGWITVIVGYRQMKLKKIGV